MIWMAWRLQRSIYVTFVVVGIVLVVYAVFNGLHIEQMRHQWLSAPCHGGNGFDAKYQSFCRAQFTKYSSSLSAGPLIHWVAVLPVSILGLLLGANVVAGEIDQHTTRLAWTQSITRTRWFMTKVAVALGSLIVLAIPLCLTVSWWLGASRWTPRISTNGFGYAGWEPLAAGVFAFAVTSAVGAVVRRPGWAVAIGLAIMVLVPWTLQAEVRTNLVPLQSTTLTITPVTKGGVTVGKPGRQAPADAWVVFSGYVPVEAGNAIPRWGQESRWLDVVNRCPTIDAGPNGYLACLQKQGLHDVQLYVADSQYWDLQLREGGLYIAGAVLLLGAGLLFVRRSQA